MMMMTTTDCFPFNNNTYYLNLEQIFPETLALNIGPQRNGSILKSLISGILDAMRLIEPDETERQTGDSKND